MSLLLFLFLSSCLRQAQVAQTGLELLLFWPLPPPPVQGLQVFTTVSGFLIKKNFKFFCSTRGQIQGLLHARPFSSPPELHPSPSTSFLLVCLFGFCFSEEDKGFKKKKR